MLAGMKTLNNDDSDMESCYLPDVEYADYNGIKRTLQLLIPNKREYHNEKYPKIPSNFIYSGVGVGKTGYI